MSSAVCAGMMRDALHVGCTVWGLMHGVLLLPLTFALSWVRSTNKFIAWELRTDT